MFRDRHIDEILRTCLFLDAEGPVPFDDLLLNDLYEILNAYVKKV